MEIMIKTIIVGIICLIICQIDLFCQELDYSMIRSEYMLIEAEDQYYLPGSCQNCGFEKFITGIRVDSSVTLGDVSVYYFNREIIDKDNFVDCVTIGSSIIGDSIIEESTGLSKCHNSRGKQIVINRLLKLGESNVVYTFDDNSYIACTVFSHDTETISGTSDSVKSLSFQRYDNEDNPISDPIEDLILRISKSYGLIKHFNFRDFPKIENSISGSTLLSNSLLKPEDYFFTYGDIFDFSVGDEFHYANNEDYMAPGGLEYVTRTVTDKRLGESTDSIWYTFQEKRWGRRLIPSNDGYTWEDYQIDTVYTTLYPEQNDFILTPDVMPLEASFELEGMVVNSLMYKNAQSYNGRFIIRKHGMEFLIEDCMMPPHDSYNGNFTYYIQGCGQLYNQLDIEMDEYCIPCEHLVYFKKGDESWGEPLGLPSETDLSPGIKIYPNPASDFIEIQNNQEITQISFYDSFGVLVKIESNLIAETIKINISNFHSGLYFIEIKTLLGEIEIKKILIN